MELYTIKKCFNCPKRLVDLDGLSSQLKKIMDEQSFNKRLAERVDVSRPMHHQMFHIALAGCPNSCSQPQIKDFGVQGQARPKVDSSCNKCGMCAATCPESAISLEGPIAFIDRLACLNCGQCIRACPTGAMQTDTSGFRILVGGKLGRHPRLASELMSLANEKEVAYSLSRCLEIFINKGHPGERFGSLIERINFNSSKRG